MTGKDDSTELRASAVTRVETPTVATATLATTLVAIVAMALIAFAGCGKDDRDPDRSGGEAGDVAAGSRTGLGSDSLPATGRDTTATATGSVTADGPDEYGISGLEPAAGSIEFTSMKGRFTATWPPGCSDLHTRTPRNAPPEELFPGTDPTSVHVFCDRRERTGDGCAVLAIFNETDDAGGPPGPRMVVRRIEATLNKHGVEIVRQSAIKHAGLEGVEVLAREPMGPGEMWMRGFLAGPHYYLQSAWKQSGQLFTDPDYKVFFDTFRVEDFDSEP